MKTMAALDHTPHYPRMEHRLSTVVECDVWCRNVVAARPAAVMIQVALSCRHALIHPLRPNIEGRGTTAHPAPRRPLSQYPRFTWWFWRAIYITTQQGGCKSIFHCMDRIGLHNLRSSSPLRWQHSLGNEKENERGCEGIHTHSKAHLSRNDPHK